jgi:hypothetical protein
MEQTGCQRYYKQQQRQEARLNITLANGGIAVAARVPIESLNLCLFL